MNEQRANMKITSKLMFRLLPVQILLAVVGAVNGIVSSFFATNFIGINAMSAVGLYNPVNLLVTAISMMLMGGSTILCGKYMGQNQQEKLQNNFSLNMIVSACVAAVFTLLLVILAMFDLTGFITKDPAVRPGFNRYLLGMAIGIFPLVVGNQLTSFLSIENERRRTTIASLVYIAVNVVLNFFLVKKLQMEARGLALASSGGLWVFFLIQAVYFTTGKSHFRLKIRNLRWEESADIIRIGLPGAAGYGYQTIRGLVVNGLLEAFVGTVGVSAFAAANNLMNIFWAIPAGMLAVSRMVMSVSIGEEDRQTLADVMRVMFRRYIPLMCAVCVGLIIGAVPLTRIFFRDPAVPVYMMTVWGLRILPLCMPFSIICMHFVCYGQASSKQGLVHALSVLDGVLCVAGFTALLIRAIGMNSVYIANVMNGVVTTLVIIGYACLKNRHFPRTMDELMVIPAKFGAPVKDRMDLSVCSIEEVVRVSREVQTFCLNRGIDRRRAYLAGLSMEEMAGNVIDHGFRKDRKKHSVDIRVVHKDDTIILRIKDDCLPFDPGERQKLMDPDDPAKNIGIRMVYRIAEDIHYQNILGLNVLTIRV